MLNVLNQKTRFIRFFTIYFNVVKIFLHNHNKLYFEFVVFYRKIRRFDICVLQIFQTNYYYFRQINIINNAIK